jgi:SAM-dependent methyltransferase
MQVNLKKIESFYRSPLGIYAYKQILKTFAKLSIGHQTKMACVSSAATFAYYDYFKNYERLALQAYNASDNWPEIGQGHYLVADRDSWPYRAEDVDIIVMTHDLEFAEHPDVYLREAWRVLKGEGQLIIIFPNRSGKWARYDTTPFGLGYPYTINQMRNLLAKSHFSIDRIEKALFFPAYQPKTHIGKFYRKIIDYLGHYCFFEAGIYVISASKHVYSPIKGINVQTAAETAKKALFPRPVAAPTTKISHKVTIR